MTSILALAAAVFGSLFKGKRALILVRPETVIRWHRQGFKLYWRWKSRPKRVGRIGRLPAEFSGEIERVEAVS
jgi:hypothetical protein